MSDELVRLADDFYSIRGDFRIGGVLNVGTQAALVRLAFDHYGVDLVHADPDTDNVASVALAGRLGMVPEGSVRDGRGVRLAVTARAWEEQGR